MGATSAIRLACGGALALLAACGPDGRPVQRAEATAPSPALAARPAASPSGAARARPALRDSPATVEAYDAAVTAWGDGLAKADAAYLEALRAAFRPGSQTDARGALAAYAGDLRTLEAGRPEAPRLRGCLARAEAPAAKAAGQLTAAIEARLARVQSLSRIGERPLGLPDYAGVAADPAAARAEAAWLRRGTEAAQAAAARCRREAERSAAGRP